MKIMQNHTKITIAWKTIFFLLLTEHCLSFLSRWTWFTSPWFCRIVLQTLSEMLCRMKIYQKNLKMSCAFISFFHATLSFWRNKLSVFIAVFFFSGEAYYSHRGPNLQCALSKDCVFLPAVFQVALNFLKHPTIWFTDAIMYMHTQVMVTAGVRLETVINSDSTCTK